MIHLSLVEGLNWVDPVRLRTAAAGFSAQPGASVMAPRSFIDSVSWW